MADTAPLPRPMVLDEFLPLVGRDLLADCNPQPVKLRLVEAVPSRFAMAGHVPFVLSLRSGPEALLVSGTYTMRGDRFGPAAIYITPVVAPFRAAPGYYYEAVFN